MLHYIFGFIHFIGIIIVIFILIPIFILRVLKFFYKSKKISRNLKFIIFTSVDIIILLVFAILVFPVWKTSPLKSSLIIEAISEAKIIMVNVYNKEGNYDFFNCSHEGIVGILNEIDKKCEQQSGKGLAITHDAASNSQAVCIYSPLNTGQWYCADSTGNAGYTDLDPGSNGYCIDGKSAICPPVI